MSRAVSAVRYASRTTGVDFEKILTWGVIGVSVYLLYKTVSTVRAVGSALESTGSAIGSGLYSILHPNEMGETKFWTATFPDGSRHAIPSKSVYANGTFKNSNLSPTYAGDGRTYQLVRANGNPNDVRAILVN